MGYFNECIEEFTFLYQNCAIISIILHQRYILHSMHYQISFNLSNGSSPNYSKECMNKNEPTKNSHCIFFLSHFPGDHGSRVAEKRRRVGEAEDSPHVSHQWVPSRLQVRRLQHPVGMVGAVVFLGPRFTCL